MDYYLGTGTCWLPLHYSPSSGLQMRLDHLLVIQRRLPRLSRYLTLPITIAPLHWSGDKSPDKGFTASSPYLISPASWPPLAPVLLPHPFHPSYLLQIVASFVFDIAGKCEQACLLCDLLGAVSLF